VHVPVIPPPKHPVGRARRSHRAAGAHLRVADRITAFAGSTPVGRDRWPTLSRTREEAAP